MATIRYPEMWLVVVSFLLLCYRIWLRRGHKNSVVPTNWPLLGMMPGLLLNTGDIHENITKLLKQSGSTFEFKGPRFANMDMLLTSDPANVHHILSKNFSNFPKGQEFKKIFDLLGDGIFNAESKSWETQRKTTMSLVNHHIFQKFVAETSWNKVEKGLIPVLENFSKLGTEVDLQELFKRFIFDTTCILVLGHDPASLSIDLPHVPSENVLTNAEEAASFRHILPESWWKLQRWLQIGREKKLFEAGVTLHQFLSECVSSKREELQQGITQMVEDPNEGFELLIGYMKAFAGESTGASGISDKFFRDISLNLMFAGRALTASLSWFFWLLAINPIEENKIREEIITNLQVKGDGKRRGFFNEEDLKKLIYLHGALSESLRLFPPVAFQHRAPLEPDILPSGHRIGPNTKTLLCFYSMGRMETIWGKDCLQFKPGRWISEEGGIKRVPSFKFVAFNAGPRSCLGREMSFIQMKVVAATIIYNYHIQIVEGHHPISPCNSVILHMKHGFKVRVKKRCV